MSPLAEKPLHELLSRSLVDIYVGPENTHWILHEKLLCARSKFFQKIFYTSQNNSSQKTFGLPDDEDEPFRQFVGWLYSGHVQHPAEEKDLTHLFDLYLMGEKWQIAGLVRDVLDAVRIFYRQTGTYPGLRRVQYIYANTDAESPMRQLLVTSVARMMTVNESIPSHWDKALRKNGQLAVDIIKSIQDWRISESEIPDPREEAGQKEKEKVKGVEGREDKMTEKTAKSIMKDSEVKLDEGNLKQKESGKDEESKKDEPKEKLTNGVKSDEE